MREGVTFGKIHDELYLVQRYGETVGEVYRPMGTAFWLIRCNKENSKLKYQNLVDAKRACIDMLTRDEIGLDYFEGC